MLHFLTAGHLDEAAVLQGRLRARVPLDETVLARLLDQYGDRNASGEITFEQKPVTVIQGCVRCPWYMPRTNATSVQFILALQAATGCVIADIEHGRIITPAELSGAAP
jgi:hypothetical protein